MADVTIKVRDNGPYLVTGEVRLVDAEGNAFTVEGTNIALCRCGMSGKKPFCDGTHRGQFENAPRAEAAS